MPWTGAAGSQTFVRTTSVYTGATCWGLTDAAHRGIRSDEHDAHDQDIAAGISATLHRSGGNAAGGNIPMAGFKLTGLGPGTAPGDSLRYEQLPSGIMTTRGDMDYYGASGPTRLPKGTAGQFLRQGANDPAWATLGSASLYDVGTIGATVPIFSNTGAWSRTQSFLASTDSYSVQIGSNDESRIPAQISTSENAPTAPVYLVQFANILGQCGSIVAGPGVTEVTYNTTSDYRMKENIRDLGDVGHVFDALQPRRFDWKGQNWGALRSEGAVGFVAHEVAAALPDVISGEKDALWPDGKIKPQGIDLSKFVPYLVAEIQSLRRRVAALEA